MGNDDYCDNLPKSAIESKWFTLQRLITILFKYAGGFSLQYETCVNIVTFNLLVNR